MDEHIPVGLPPNEVVESLAREKAMSVAERLSEGLVVGADTIVVWRGRLLGKPASETDAVAMLKNLQGDMHEVFTGVALVDAGSGKVMVGHDCTKVFFRSLDEEEIHRYVQTGEPLDKAGAYGAQGIGSVFMERISGSYTNVVGLPLTKIYLMLRDFGCSVL